MGKNRSGRRQQKANAQKDANKRKADQGTSSDQPTNAVPVAGQTIIVESGGKEADDIAAGKKKRSRPWSAKHIRGSLIVLGTITLAVVALYALILQKHQQRADIGIYSMRIDDLVDGKQPTATVILTNTGKEPAVDLIAIVQLRFRHDDLTYPPGYDPLEKRPSKAVISSGTGHFLTATTSHIPVPDKYVGDVDVGVWKIYLYGRLTYHSGDSTADHGLEFCGVYLPETKRFSQCPEYNRTW
jgi:hypothetical protein